MLKTVLEMIAIAVAWRAGGGFSIVSAFGKLVLSASILAYSLPGYSDYSNHPLAQSFIEKMHKMHGFEPQKLKAILEKVEKQQAVLDAISRPAEKTKEWFEYRKIFIQDSRIEQGVTFWEENKASIDKASAKFSVSPEIIVAIIGVETRYGRHTGTYRVLDALSTLGFDYPKRSKFFLRELEEFLLLAREQKQDPFSLKGSYAGAMGYGQFIPSSYRAYAVDFDGDNFVDIWNNPVDAIGSVANYFSVHKWRYGEPVLTPAKVDKGFDRKLLNSKAKPKLSLESLKAKGFAPQRGVYSAQEKAIPLRFMGDGGEEYWLGFDNFYVITRYNRSHLYAMAVYELSQAIKRKQKASAKPVKS